MLLTNISKASRPLAGETECGDQVGIVRSGHVATVVVADGLGHGAAAAAAARAAVETVLADPWADLVALLHRCDRALVGTRGAAVTVMRVHADTRRVLYAGVGNVELVALSQSRVQPINAPGVVGGRIHKVRESEHTVGHGDILVLHTDGISSSLDLAPYRHQDAATIAVALLHTAAKPNDDAACAVIRICRIESELSPTR